MLTITKKYLYYPVKEISRLYKHMIDANEITRPKICPKSDKTMACWLKRYVEKPKNEKKIPRIGANMSNDYEVCELVCAVYFAGKTAQHLNGYNFDTKLENLLSADADVFDKFRASLCLFIHFISRSLIANIIYHNSDS